MRDRTSARLLLSSLTFSAWFAALLFGVLGPAAHLFLLAAILLWPWRATWRAARGDTDSLAESAMAEAVKEDEREPTSPTR